MYVCLCNQVTDREIRSAAESGISSMSALRKETGCAGNCGKCAPLAREILREYQSNPFLEILSDTATI